MIAVDICEGLVYTGADEVVRIMPNPTIGWCTLMLGPITGPALICVHDATAAVVLRISVNGPGPHALNMEGMSAGTYEVRAQGRSGSARGRLVLLCRWLAQRARISLIVSDRRRLVLAMRSSQARASSSWWYSSTARCTAAHTASRSQGFWM